MFLAAYCEDTDVFKEKWAAYDRISGNRSFQLLKVWLPDSEADRQLMLPLIPKKILALLLYEQLSWYFDENVPYEAYYHALLGSFDEMPDTASGANLDTVLQYAVLRGDWPVLERCIPKFPEEYRSMAYSGIYSFIQGDNASALTFFNNAQLLYKKANRSKNNALSALPGVFYALALLAKGEAEDLVAAQRVIEQGVHRQDTYATSFMILQSLLFLREGKKGGAIQAFKQIPDRFSHPVFRVLYHVTGEILEKNSISQKRIDDDLNLLGSMKYDWAINELTALSDQPLRPEMGTPIIARFPRVEDWVLALNALLQVSEQSTTVTAKENDTRLVWLVNFERKDIEAKEQTFGKKGWSAGGRSAITG